jgi:hypothetical protein
MSDNNSVKAHYFQIADGIYQGLSFFYAGSRDAQIVYFAADPAGSYTK